ncbi:phage distal tail protein [Streptomyces sp. NPDC085665]|uniref:phage distal tail protein n=1 Tax=Streptomyces sp. NPDC085665 TaxID=3365735 RepID=UPI0037CFBC00
MTQDGFSGQFTGTKAVTLGNDTSASGSDYPLIPGTDYRAEARAGDATSWGPWSDPAFFTTKGIRPVPTAGTVTPAVYSGEPWTMEYGGLLLGGPSAIVLHEPSGLIDSPEVRTSDRTLLQRHGASAGTDYLGARVVQLGFTVLDDPGALADVLRVFQPGGGDQVLRFAVPGLAGDRGRLTARVRKRSAPVGSVFAAGAARFDVELWAADPVLYADQQSTARVVPLAPRGSVPVFPLRFPFGFMKAGAVYVSPPEDIAVDGNTATWPTYTIKGPVVNPSIINRTTGERITVQITVPTAEVLTIDTRARTVLLNGASRYGALTSDSVWFPFRPGVARLEFDDLLGDKARGADVRWRSAWL